MDDFTRRPARPVMDFTPRRPIQPSVRQPAPVAPVAPAIATPAPLPVPQVFERPEPIEPIIESTPIPEVKSDHLIEPKSHKVGAPIAAIVVAILVSAGLVALTFFAYKHHTQAAKPTDANSLKETSDSQAIQKDSEDIDKAINDLDDATDFNETDLSDQSLQL